MLFQAMFDAFAVIVKGLANAVPDFGLAWPWGAIEVTVWPWFPADVFLSTGLVAVVWIGVLCVFTLAEWVYRHIPQVFGVGPGAG